MILTGPEIIAQQRRGRIRIDPFDSEMVTTNSCDLRLGGSLLTYRDEVLDVRKLPDYDITEYPPGASVHIARGAFLLGHSRECVGSDYYVPLIHARSGVARLGLFVHITADLIDIGSHGMITFQLFAAQAVDLIVGMRIAQVSFWKPEGEIKLYEGKYQGSKGPRASMIAFDFEG